MSVNIFKNGILSKIAGAVGDAVPLINNFLTNQEGKGAADANTVYVLNNKIDELNSSLYKLDYDNMVDLSGILNKNGSTYTPTKGGMIICKLQATANNGAVCLKQHDVEIMFLNVYNQYTRNSSQVIVNPETVTLYQIQNAKIETFKFIPFK